MSSCVKWLFCCNPHNPVVVSVTPPTPEQTHTPIQTLILSLIPWQCAAVTCSNPAHTAQRFTRVKTHKNNSAYVLPGRWCRGSVLAVGGSYSVGSVSSFILIVSLHVIFSFAFHVVSCSPFCPSCVPCLVMVYTFHSVSL